MALQQIGNLVSLSDVMRGVNAAASSAAQSEIQTLQAGMGVLDTFQNVASKEFEKEMIKREDEAIEQGMLDAKSNTPATAYVADLRDGERAYDVAYNKAVKAEVASNISMLTREEALRLSQEYPTDPDKFKGGMQGLLEGLTEQYGLDTYSQQILQQSLKEETFRYLPQISSNGYKKLKADQFAAQSKDLQSVQNFMLNAARTGDIKNYTEFNKQYTDRLGLMLTEGLIDQQQYNEAITKVEKEAESQLGFGEVERLIVTNSFREAYNSANGWKAAAQKDSLMSPDEIDVEYNKMISAIASSKRLYDKENEMQVKVQKTLTSDIILDYKDRNDKEAVNFETKRLLGENPDYTVPKNRVIATQIATSTGVVPESYVSYIRKSQFSDDPEVILSGVTSLKTLVDSRPEYRDQFPEKDVNFAYSVDGLIKAGMSNDQAIVAARTAQTTEFKQLQQYNLNEIGDNKDFINKVRAGVTDFLDDNLNVWTEFGETITIEQEQSIQADYDRLFKHNLGKTANVEGAQELTRNQLKRKYGITYINGKREMVAYPIEQTATGISMNQVTKDNPVTLQWAKDKKSFMESYGITDENNITLKPTPVVTQGVPVYQVYTKDANGVWNPATVTKSDGSVVNRFWNFDNVVYNKEIEDKNKKLIDEARAKHEAKLNEPTFQTYQQALLSEMEGNRFNY